MDELDADELVALEGYLVDVDGKTDSRVVWWRTSLGRGDAASGACEIFYVKKVTLGDKIYT
ncbi:MAG: hypothetical protein V1875_09355 [Candidatus Altiarchaeota archaeon]